MRRKAVQILFFPFLIAVMMSGCSSLLHEQISNAYDNGIGSVNESVSKDENVDEKAGKETKKLDSICLYEWDDDNNMLKMWSLSDYSYTHPDTPYYLNVYGDFGKGKDYVDGLFTAEKSGYIFETFEGISKQGYKPEHPNEDGLLIKEYYPNSIQAFYSFYDEEGKPINNTSDERYKRHKDEMNIFCVVSDEDYNYILNGLEELRMIVEKNATQE